MSRPQNPRSKNPRSGAGPGRGGSRANRRPRASADPVVERPAERALGDDEGAVSRHRGGVTRRTLLMLVVLVILGLSYASSLRVYFATEREKAADRHRIEQSQQRIAELEDDLRRWNDPDFVAAEARSRLGWVVPGDTGYRVIGPDGEVVGIDDRSDGSHAPDERGPWYQRMSDSVNFADQPPTQKPEDEGGKVDPGERPPITTEGN